MGDHHIRRHHAAVPHPIPALLLFPPRPAKDQSLHPAFAGMDERFPSLAGCPLRVKGREHFSKGSTYIVVCNHNALVDVPVSTPFIPGGNKTIAKIEMARVPVFGLMYRTGSVLVDRKDENSRRESFTKMKEVLDMGLHMCLYPEGTRKQDRPAAEGISQWRFPPGASNGQGHYPRPYLQQPESHATGKTFYFRPHRLGLHFLPPIVPAPGETADALRQRVFEVMWDYYTGNA